MMHVLITILQYLKIRDQNRKLDNQINRISNMGAPTEINSVYWNEDKKSWEDKIVKVDEYFGFSECQQCRRPMSHNIKTGGEFKMVYVRCGCSRRKSSF